MSPITTTTEIDRSADDVFAYATDPTRFNEWQKSVGPRTCSQIGCSESYWLTTGLVGVLIASGS